MPRAKRASDELYNIRRRLKRAAERFERQADSAGSAVDKRQLLKSAEALRTSAQSMYVRNITTGRAGSNERKRDISRTVRENTESSKRFLVGAQRMNPDQAREQMKDSIIHSAAGNDFFAATVDIWRGTDYNAREETVMERFREIYPDVPVRDILDVMQWFAENTGIDYLETGYDEEMSDDERYLARSRAGMLLVLESGLAN